MADTNFDNLSISGADNLSFPSGEVNKTKRIKSPHLGPRNDDDDKANSSKKIRLKVVDKSLCEMMFSVQCKAKLSSRPGCPSSC